jgi:hypothetical protein
MIWNASFFQSSIFLLVGLPQEEIDIGPVRQTVAGGKKIEEDECDI